MISEIPGVGGVTSDAGGGIAFAVTRATKSFRALDKILYDDPNVPCGRRPDVQWLFGNGNAGGSQPIYGWLPKVNPSPTQPIRTCPEPTS